MWSKYLNSQSREEKKAYSVILLNLPIQLEAFDHLWLNAKLRICADGGANRLYEYCEQKSKLLLNDSRYAPHFIHGDLDSLDPAIGEYYERTFGTRTSRESDQDSTDLVKCLELVKKEGEGDPVFVVGALGGRFDQSISNINSAFAYCKELSICLISDKSYAFVLEPGTHEIEVDLSFDGPSCGILPFDNRKTIVSTSGFKWNLNDQETRFGGLISTSNAFDATEKSGKHSLKITTTGQLLFTIEI